MLWPVEAPGAANRQREENAGVGGVKYTRYLFRRCHQSVYVEAIRYDSKQRTMRLLSTLEEIVQGREQRQVVAKGALAPLLS
jgi:hypothetical protein